MGRNSETEQRNKEVKRALTRVKSGCYVGGQRKAGEIPRTLRLFGCQACSWIGTNMCPHQIMIGNHHSNWICSDRIQYIKNEMIRVGTVPRLLQNELAIQLKMLQDKMLFNYSESGELHEDFKHLNKNLISLIDKMRRQDEGIKFSEDITVTHQDFRKMVDVEAKKIEERNKQTKPAEFTEEI